MDKKLASAASTCLSSRRVVTVPWARGRLSQKHACADQQFFPVWLWHWQEQTELEIRRNRIRIGCLLHMQNVGDQLVEMEALKAAAARAAAAAADRLASLQRDYDAVVAERDTLRTEVAALRSQTCILAAQ